MGCQHNRRDTTKSVRKIKGFRRPDIPGKTRRTIGITGAGRGTGTTHLAVWTANYLAGVQGRRVAVLEWNDHGDFARMGRFCGKIKAGDLSLDGAVPESGVRHGAVGTRYQLLDVDYYADADAAVMAACLSGNYQDIIVDYGELTGASVCECARCDRKVIVGALSEWQAEAFLEAAGMDTKRDKSWSYAAAFGSEQTRRETEKAFRIKCLRIPTSVDAFTVRRADMDFFERLLY